MGIPSYFSYILKHYSITKLHKKKDLNNIFLYLDCNSFIYDAIYSGIETTHANIFESVKKQIEYFIALLNPVFTYIAFDGVVPMAKMKQQRERRFKSHMLKMCDESKKQIHFDTCQITPGTRFMNELDHYIQTFVNTNKQYNIVFSGSCTSGEGEHKIFKHIRNTDIYSNTIYIYGLDADLIILSLGHLHCCSNLFLIREDMDNNLMELDIQSLQLCIQKEINPKQSPHIVTRDYIALSFLLGNDFLPHSPVLNIRTLGIPHLMSCYKKIISMKKHTLCNKHTINWNFFKELCTELSKNEHDYLQTEVKYREKQRKHIIYQNKTKNMMSLPLVNQDRERLLRIHEKNWKHRYYQILFHEENPDESFIRRICIHYMEGLQWCLHYYSNECIDTEWYYPYAYPPLFSDILQYIPSKHCDLFPHKTMTLKSPLEQLCIVLPPSSYYLLPPVLQEKMRQYIHFTGFDTSDPSLQWDFCTYLWESHPLLFPIFQTTIHNLTKQI